MYVDRDADAELSFEFAILFTQRHNQIYAFFVSGRMGRGTNVDDINDPAVVFGTRFAVSGYIWIALGDEDVVFGHGVGFCACLSTNQSVSIEFAGGSAL